MNCYKCKQLIDKMHSDTISNNELQSVLHHIKECESCRTYYNVMENIISDLSSFEEVELPKGFHNKLHFALKREAENPKKTSKPFAKGMKFAAIGAFSVLLIIAAVSLLPSSMNDTAFDMAMEEAAEAPKEMMAAEKCEEAGYADTSVDGDMRNDNTNSSQAFETVEETAAEEAEAEEMNPCPMVTLSDGNTVVLILDVDDVNAVYESLLENLPEPLPEIGWIFEDIPEPAEYRQIRLVMDAAEAEYSAGQIADEYAYNIEYYQNANLIYDEDEAADLQNIGYVFIVIK